MKRLKKVAVLNFSGNVGKTMVSAHLLLPRIEGASVISIETLNVDAKADGIEVEQMRGKQYLNLIEDLMQRDAAIIDVGASNAEEFMRGMRALAGSHVEFDCFVVPTVHSKKQIADTINTVTALAALGVEADKIRIVFNKLEDGDTVADHFDSLLAVVEDGQCCVADPQAVIYHNEVFERLKGVGKSLVEVTMDETPWRQRFTDAQNERDRQDALRMLTLKRLSASASANLDSTFRVLFA